MTDEEILSKLREIVRDADALPEALGPVDEHQAVVTVRLARAVLKRLESS